MMTDLPKKSEVDKHLPEGHVAAREQQGKPQSLQGLSDTLGNSYPVVVSTGRTHHDEVVMEAELAANPPTDWVPAQDPTPPKAGDTVPVNPRTGELSFQGGPGRIVSPNQPVHAGEAQVGDLVESDLSEVAPELEGQDPKELAKHETTDRTVHGKGEITKRK